GQPPRDQLGAARGADRVADRDQRAEQDQDRPLDHFVGFAQAQRPQQDQQHGRAEERDRDRQQVERDEDHRGGERRDRHEALAPATEPQVALGERQHAQVAQRVGHLLELAPQDDHVAGLEQQRAQAVGDPLAAAAYREQAHLEAFGQPHLAGGAADEQRVAGDDALHHAGVLRIVLLVGLDPFVARQFEFALRYDLLERARFALEQQQVAGVQRPVIGGG